MRLSLFPPDADRPWRALRVYVGARLWRTVTSWPFWVPMAVFVLCVAGQLYWMSSLDGEHAPAARRDLVVVVHDPHLREQLAAMVGPAVTVVDELPGPEDRGGAVLEIQRGTGPTLTVYNQPEGTALTAWAVRTWRSAQILEQFPATELSAVGWDRPRAADKASIAAASDVRARLALARGSGLPVGLVLVVATFFGICVGAISLTHGPVQVATVQVGAPAAVVVLGKLAHGIVVAGLWVAPWAAVLVATTVLAVTSSGSLPASAHPAFALVLVEVIAGAMLAGLATATAYHLPRPSVREAPYRRVVRAALILVPTSQYFLLFAWWFVDAYVLAVRWPILGAVPWFGIPVAAAQIWQGGPPWGVLGLLGELVCTWALVRLVAEWADVEELGATTTVWSARSWRRG